MPMYYLPNSPDEITEDSIEIICGDLQCAMQNVLVNEGDDEEYDKAIEIMKHASAVLNMMMPDEET